jgi:hypothetical protein
VLAVEDAAPGAQAAAPDDAAELRAQLDQLTAERDGLRAAVAVVTAERNAARVLAGTG